MTVNPTSTVASQFKDAMYALTVDLFKDDPDVTVSFGHPGTQSLGQDLIVFLDMTSKQDPATLGPNRSRDETIELDVGISSVMAGVADDQPPTDRVYSLLSLIGEKLRTGDPTLGNLVLWCFMTEHQSKGATAPEDLPEGRAVYLIARFTARARIR